MKKIMFICTGNMCRSQMAEGWARELGNGDWEAFSSGSHPAGYVHPKVIQVMQEVGIDVSNQTSKGIDPDLIQKMDCVVTVCDSAAAYCPSVSATAKKIHIPIGDPFGAVGTEEDVLNAFRKIRDDVKKMVQELM